MTGAFNTATPLELSAVCKMLPLGLIRRSFIGTLVFAAVAMEIAVAPAPMGRLVNNCWPADKLLLLLVVVPGPDEG